MDTVVYDRIEDVLGRIESLYGRVEDTYLVAKDILLGTQISDWIADLAASGTSSATYQDASRMNTLIANNDAVNTTSIATLLRDWSIANNKTGIFFGTYLNNPSGVDWSSLTTPSSITANAIALNAIVGNDTAFRYAFDLTAFRNTLYDNSLVTESIMQANLSKFNRYKSDFYAAWNDSSSRSGKLFVIDMRLSENSSHYGGNYTYNVTFKDGSSDSGSHTSNAPSGNTIATYNRFCSNVSMSAGGGWIYCDYIVCG